MGLSDTDKMPSGISTIEAYKKIKSWYQNNLNHKRLDKSSDYGKSSEMLIQNLPDPVNVKPVEIKAVFREVIAGKMEWAYHETDNDYKMAAYAVAALETARQDYSLSEEEFTELKKSNLWKYITQSR